MRPLKPRKTRRTVALEDRLLARARAAQEDSEQRRRIWRTANALREFSTAEMAACTEVGVGPVRKYLQALAEAGFLRVVPARLKAAGEHNRYRLVRYSGPKPPRPMRPAHVYDPNADTLHLRARHRLTAALPRVPEPLL
jgi:hypothetical protein